MIVARALNVGDLVNLKSGGPTMTVESTDGTRVTCVYFNVTSTDVTGADDTEYMHIYDPTLYRVTFNEIVLELVADPENIQ